MKVEFPKGFFSKVRKEATNEDIDEKEIVMLAPEDISFVSEKAKKEYYEALDK